jgi:hypothetical protein
VIKLRLDCPEFESSQGLYLSSIMYIPAPELVQLPVQWVVVAVSPDLKRPGREDDHSHPVPRLRMSGAIIPLPPICLRGVYRNKFALQLFLSAV